MKRLIRTVYALCVLAASAFLAGCGTAITIQASSPGVNHIEVSVNLGDTLYNTIKNAYENAASAAGTTQPGAFSVFDAAGIESSLEDMGFTNVRAVSDAPARLDVSADGAAAAFVTTTDSSVVVRLAPDNIRRFVNSLPEETRYYTDLLMAPVLTGEALSETDYREVLAAVYGEDLAGEAENAVVSLTIRDASGTEKTFNIPLLSLLTLKDEAIYSPDY